jgi:hypothetical protein
VGLAVKPVGKPDAGNPHVRFDERGRETGRLAQPQATAPFLDLAFALRYSGRKRVNDAGEMMASIVAKRLVEHLDRSGFVIMKEPPIGGGAAIGRGFEG